jgi:hypothetical protein
MNEEKPKVESLVKIHLGKDQEFSIDDDDDLN